jgi:hypothetical protein
MAGIEPAASGLASRRSTERAPSAIDTETDFRYRPCGDEIGSRTRLSGVAARRLCRSAISSWRKRGESNARAAEGRRFSKPLCKTDMHVASVGGEWRNRTPGAHRDTLVFGTSYRPFSGTLRGGSPRCCPSLLGFGDRGGLLDLDPWWSDRELHPDFQHAELASSCWTITPWKRGDSNPDFGDANAASSRLDDAPSVDPEGPAPSRTCLQGTTPAIGQARSAWQGSNLRLPGPRPGALPLRYTPPWGDWRDSHPLGPGSQPGASTASASATVSGAGWLCPNRLPLIERALS